MTFLRYKGRLILGAALLFFVAQQPGLSQAAPPADELAQQSHEGKQLMAEGRFEEAIGVYRKLVQALPGNLGLLLNLALAEEMAGHPSQAIPHFQAVLKAEPNNIPALMSLSMARLQLNRPAEAIPLLKRLVTLQPDNINARGMLAGAEMSLGNLESAAEQYRQLTSLNPSDAKAWYGLGKAYEALAADRFQWLTKLAPESGFVADLLADSQVQRHQYRSAFFFYREAEKKTPTLPGIHAGLARVYRSTGHEDWAAGEEKLERTANCTVQTAECRFLHGDFLGAAKAAAGNTADSLFWATKAYNELAIEAFDRLGQLPESVEIHALKAQILRSHGQDLDAAKEWRAALALAPGDPQLRTEWATSLFLAHDYSSAMPVLRELLAANPQSPDLNFMLGESLWHTQQANEALPYLEAALRRDPNMLSAHAALGLALVSLHRDKEAIPHLEKAVSLDDDGSLHYSLARAYLAVGDTSQARRNMEEYQTIQQRNRKVNDELAKEAEIVAPGDHPSTSN